VRTDSAAAPLSAYTPAMSAAEAPGRSSPPEGDLRLNSAITDTPG
jgi:hypothetical protein